MDSSQYVSLMKQRLTASFDIVEPPSEEFSNFELWAVHNRTSQKYFLSKSISLYTVNNDEYVGLQVYPNGIRETDLQTCAEKFKRLMRELPADEQHMSSIFTASLVSEKEIPESVTKQLAKMKFHKDYRFTLRGWSDLAVILVDLPNRRIYSNPFGKKIVPNYVFTDTDE